MKFGIAEVYGQVYIFPFVKVTHTRKLNGDIEVIIGWLKWEVIFSI